MAPTLINYFTLEDKPLLAPLSVDKSFSSSGALIPCEHFECGGLSSSIYTKKPKTFSWLDTHAQAVNCKDAAHLPRLVNLQERRKYIG